MLRLTENGAPLARQTLVDSVYETILEAILCGRLSSGTELNEVALARELGVSRTPVHEALAWLAADELIELIGSRARVKTLSPQEVTDIYDVRLLLECAAAERAAERIDEQTLGELRIATNELARTRKDPSWAERAIEFDIRFHEMVAAASGNARLHAEIRRYRLLVRAFCRLTGEHLHNLRDSFEEHVTILKALERRDARAARQAMATHIQKRVQAVLTEVYRVAPGAAAAADGSG